MPSTPRRFPPPWSVEEQDACLVGSTKKAPWPTTVYDRPRLVTVAWSKRRYDDQLIKLTVAPLGHPSPERVGSKNKASLPVPGHADTGRIVKGGRVATIAGCRHLRLGV